MFLFCWDPAAMESQISKVLVTKFKFLLSLFINWSLQREKTRLNCLSNFNAWQVRNSVSLKIRFWGWKGATKQNIGNIGKIPAILVKCSDGKLIDKKTTK